MAFDEVMGTLMRWATATEALAALGAELTLLQSPGTAPPEVVSALEAVSAAGGIGDLGELAPPQQAMVLSFVRMYLAHANELLGDPGRAPGWTYTDPAILDGWGRGSSMVPQRIAAAHPDLGEVTSFLDVGTGVGLLAVAAANVWPGATVVGIDPWEASLERARTNIAHAGVEDRVTVRRQSLEDLDDTDAYDCVWVPTFFLTEPALEEALPAVVRATRPGGWIALGRTRPMPDPLAEAVASLRWVRGGGGALDGKRAAELLEAAGCTAVHAAPPAGPSPLELVLGQRPSP